MLANKFKIHGYGMIQRIEKQKSRVAKIIKIM